MANQPEFSKYNDPQYRNAFPLPLANEFFNLLQDRLHTCVERVLFMGDTRFTIILNAIPRDGIETTIYSRDQNPDFIYAGCKMQRDLLEHDALKRWHKVFKNTPTYENAWKELSKLILISREDVPIGDTIYGLIQNGYYDVKSTSKIYKLKDYFSKVSLIDKTAQSYELIILSPFFDIEQDIFVSIPLIGYAEFDGVAHIILKKELLNSIIGWNDGDENLPYKIVWFLIRAFNAEYDTLFLDWDTIGENLEKTTATYDFLVNTVFKSDEYFNQKIKNPILKELKLQEYYKTHANYFLTRLKLNEGVPGKVYQQYITNAVTAILIDSYAHNVSAHALSTLSWWYSRRAKQLKEEELNWDVILTGLRQGGEINIDVIENFRQEILARRKKREEDERKKRALLGTGIDLGSKKPDAPIRVEDGAGVINYPGSLSREMSRLLRFLTEKGAYWGGVTRDINVGGRIISLYNVLWHDFINNPFYLGTIAKTEDILKIKIRIVLYDSELIDKNRPSITAYHKKTFNPKNSGILAWVDLSAPRKDLAQDDAKSPHADTLSAFVHKGDDFSYFRDELRNIKVFFPGDVVGRHAFYTMIENEIRNVKHYSKQELETIRKEGLTVAIGIQQCSLHESTAQEIYRISIWLDTPTQLAKGEKHLIEQKWEAFKGEIFGKNYAARLGGTYQDKVCAAFLLNGDFSGVQRGDRNPYRDKNKDSNRDVNYYPWVRAACSRLEKEEEEPNTHIDYKRSYNSPEQMPELPKMGLLKKVFYVWRGERLLEWDGGGGSSSDWDNPARFSIVHIDKKGGENEYQQKFLNLRRHKGMVRVVNEPLTDQDENMRYIAAYKFWLKKLLGDSKLYVLRISDEKQPRYLLGLENSADQLRFVYENFNESSHQVVSLHEAAKNIMRTNPALAQEWLISIAHQSGTDDDRNRIIRYRSHGIFKNHFFPEQSGLPAHLDDLKMMELFEVLATKVCIFDNRIYHRLRLDEGRDQYNAFLRNQLKLSVHKEAKEKEGAEDVVPTNGRTSGWLSALSEAERSFVQNCHFLVMHLSFIESILKHENPNLHANDASNVGLFLKEQIMPFVKNRENFFFVVTTGRGRNEWWSSLTDEEEHKTYASFTFFRPIESLLTAIENSISMEDDIELKYRIVKILYGS